jgi:hypothetical protein
MRLTRFKKVYDFCQHLVTHVENGIGPVSKKRVSSVKNDDLQQVVGDITAALQLHFKLPVHVKENICAGSKTTTIAIFFLSRWIYLSFRVKNHQTEVIVFYRKGPIEGVHRVVVAVDLPVVPREESPDGSDCLLPQAGD